MACSSFGADMTIGQVEKFSRAIFFKDGKPKAPSAWPKNLNIPIAVYSKFDELKKGEMERIGCDLAIAAFFWSWSRAMVACPEDRGVLPGWEILGVAGFPGLQCVCVKVCVCVCAGVCGSQSPESRHPSDHPAQGRPCVYAVGQERAVRLCVL